MEEMVTIPLSEYQILKSGVVFINCLKMVGVEDWSEYHNAMVLFGGLLEDELDVDFAVDELDELEENTENDNLENCGLDCDCCINDCFSYDESGDEYSE